MDVSQSEFYEIDEGVPVPELDNEDRDLLKRPGGLTPVEQANFKQLSKRLKKLLASQPTLDSNPSYAGCPGDGNLDLVVNRADLRDWELFACPDGSPPCSSWYDFNFDGTTDQADRHIIEENLGRKCRKRR